MNLVLRHFPFSHILNLVRKILFSISISMFTIVRAAKYFFKWQKSGFSQYYLEEGFLSTVMQKTFSCKPNVSWHLPDLTLRHLNLWKEEPWSLVQTVNRVFPSHPSRLLPDWHNSMAALLQDIWAAADKCDYTFFSQICMAVQYICLSQLIFCSFFDSLGVFSQTSPWSSLSSGCTNDSGVM